ncbi:MAG TPA: tripartite tricarboxylate transporter permease [Hyphomicrobiaceae bacterium]|nr:tripartite tricarboxylate transporter permease [Hyphomicrobiaceae bacterium]
MDILAHLATGFGAAATPINLAFCLIGVLLGTAVGVLPGIGPVATIAMLLPITYGAPPLGALIMLAGIYYGAQYGGSTTAILVNLPGESSSVVTCIDGYQMARRGRAGAALSIAAVASFAAGCVGTLVLAAFAPALASVGDRFVSPEYCALMLFGLVAAVVLAHGSAVKAVGMVLLGLLFGIVGTDTQSGALRFTLGIDLLYDGIDFIPVAMGLFGISEIMRNLDRSAVERSVRHAVGSLWPTREEVRQAWPAALRGTWLGAGLGILPGGGAVLSSFAAYVLEKRVSRTPECFGQGAVEGVAGPEAANNAASQTSFVPLLTLGMPSNPVMALMMGAMVIQGIAPGTAVITERPELFWGMVASMWIGNLMLVIINLPLIGIWVRMLRVPYRVLFPCILVLCCAGAYSAQQTPIILMLTAAFALLGYIFLKLGCEGAPFILGFVLGPLMEENLRRSMSIYNGDLTIFITRPICAGLLVATLALVLLIVVPRFRKTRDTAFQEDD